MADTMTFDHLPQYKRSFDIGWVSRVGAKSGVTIEQLRAEIAKCEVVCWGCHKKREKQRNREHEEQIKKAAEDKKMAEALTQVFAIFQRVTIKFLRRRRIIQHPTEDQCQKNLKDFALSVALGCLWTKKAQERAEAALATEYHVAYIPIWQIVEENHTITHDPLRVSQYDEGL
jgi:hypothetical protein